jgi:hypothetical protein
MTTGARKGAVEWYGIGLVGGPEGSPPEERFTERKSSKTATNDYTANGGSEPSGPEININAYESEPRGVIDKKGSLHSLHSPEDEKCPHNCPAGSGCCLCDPERQGGAA